MKRGTILWVNLGDAHPPEMGKVRPAIVLSNSTLNSRLDTVVVVPLSSQPAEIWPLRVKVTVGGRKPGFAVLPGLRQVAKMRLLDTIGILPPADLRRVDQAAAEYLSD
jgi:mRNA interferase MazF